MSDIETGSVWRPRDGIGEEVEVVAIVPILGAGAVRYGVLYARPDGAMTVAARSVFLEMYEEVSDA